MSDDRRPHSRACGWKPHDHGTACHPNCPTCGSVSAPAAAVPEAEDGRGEFRSERLRSVIAEELHEAAPLLTLPQIEQAAEVAAHAAERWWLSTSLRTKPDFIRALIEADQFDWANAKPESMEAFAQRMDRLRAERRSAVPARDDEQERLAAVLALRELVRLKDLKDRIDAPDGNEWSSAYYAARADYRENKPKAWAAARAALAAAPLPKGQEG